MEILLEVKQPGMHSFQMRLQSQSLRQQILHLLQSWEAFFYHDILDSAFSTMERQVEAEEWTNLDELIEMQESVTQSILVRAR